MRRHLGFLLLALTLVAVSGSVPGGHTPISSRWNYNEHLFPIFRDRCGACHMEGGIAPMSLLEYQSAYPWTQSIREEILGLRMPPWQAEDGFGDFKNGHALAAHEMDMILEWSSGGYPQGPRNLTPAPPLVADTWALGEPTLTLQLAEPFVLGPSANDVVRYFVVPSGTSEDHILTGVDFRPGAQAVVRGALVFVDATGTAQTLDADDDGPGFAPADGQPFPTSAPVGVFTPGQEAVLNIDVGYPLPAGADIVVRIHYKKTWITEGMDFADQSQIGLHFSNGDARKIESLLVMSPLELETQEVTFTHTVTQESTILSLFPEIDIQSTELRVEAIRPDGSRAPMLWLREPDTGWPTRFWFESPLALPAGSQLEVTALLEPSAQRVQRTSPLGGGSSPIRMSVDYLVGDVAAND